MSPTDQDASPPGPSPEQAFPDVLLQTMLHNPARLAAVQRVGLLDTAPDPVFDRFTRLVRFALGVPVALISLVDAQRQFFKSALGLPAEWEARRGSPLSHCFCQFAIATRLPFQTGDARTHPWVCDNLAIPEMGVIAYFGVPIFFLGQAIGTLVAISSEPRRWSEPEQSIMRDIAQLLERELRNRDVHVELAELAEKAELERLRLNTLIQTMSESVFLAELDGRLHPLNQAAHRSEISGIDLHESGREFLAKAMAGESVRDFELAVPLRGPTQRWHNLNAMPLKERSGRINGVMLVGRDITESHRAAQELLRQKTEIDDLYENAPCGYQSVDAHGLYLRANRTLLAWLGYDREELVGKRRIQELTPPEFAERAALNMERLKVSGAVHDVRFELRRRDGSWLPVMLNASAVYDVDGAFVMSRATLVDFSRMEQAEAQLQRLMRTDPLTGAFNRRGFFSAFEALRQLPTDSEGLLIYLDVDGLKAINDSLGHRTGDIAIVACVDVLRLAFGESALIARMGGDEFAVALPGPLAEEHPIAQLEQARCAYNRDSGAAFELKFSLGSLPLRRSDLRSADELLGEVDRLMYVEKRGRRFRKVPDA